MTTADKAAAALAAQEQGAVLVLDSADELSLSPVVLSKSAVLTEAAALSAAARVPLKVVSREDAERLVGFLDAKQVCVSCIHA